MRLFFGILLTVFTFSIQAQVNLSYYLPDTTALNPAITSPKEFLGFQIGEWHISHDQQTYYMKQLADESDRIIYEVRGRSHENRPMVNMIISHPDNLARLDEIKENHRQLSEIDGPKPEISDDQPIVVWQGYSIHGNEPSGANAAMLVAYYLAAGENDQILNILKNTVIIFYPSYNPDGMQRFSTWVNMNKSKTLNPDNQDREYDEVWPKGRTNHYGFDLNRDWLPLQQPESVSKIDLFQEWRPNVLTDHHEMGTNTTYFFQPGIPSRTNPMTPEINQKLTEEIGYFHAEALDSIGSLYYAKESYDDYFYGKGSTYPDIQGSIGILFEQASSRGHVQNSIHGEHTFPFTIRNQFVTSFSTLKAAIHLKKELLEYQRDFYRDQDFSTREGYVFGSEETSYRTRELARILQHHQIDIYATQSDTQGKENQFKAGHSYFVPLAQRQQQLIRAIFEITEELPPDSLFYDVSAWTFPLAFNLPYEKINQPGSLLKVEGKISVKSVPFERSDYAYVMPWTHYLAPKVLYRLLEEGIRVKTASQPFSYSGRDFDYGSLLIPLQNQNAERIEAILKEAAADGIESIPVHSSLTDQVNLGSRNFLSVTMPKVALIVGDGASAYSSAEVWHLLDTRYKIPVTRLEGNRLSSYNLDEYNVIVMSDSRIQSYNKNELERWIRRGGVIIAMGSSGRWLSSQNIGKFDYKSLPVIDSTSATYEEMTDLYGARVTGGSIMKAYIDRSHPIAFGYSEDVLPVFKNNNFVFEPSKLRFRNPIVYAEDPLWSGYLHPVNAELFSGASALQIDAIGRGRVINFADNPNFRAFWYGTNRLFANALFFGNLINQR